MPLAEARSSMLMLAECRFKESGGSCGFNAFSPGLSSPGISMFEKDLEANI